MNTKTCNTCGVEYPKTNEFFHYRNKKKNYLKPSCKTCRAKEAGTYYLNNKEKVLERQREYCLNNRQKRNKQKLEHYHSNKEQILEQQRARRAQPKVKEKNRLYKREYNSRPEVKERRNEQMRERRRDPVIRIQESVSNQVRKGLLKSGSVKDNATWEALPYTPDELIVHLETHDEWEEWMTWDNYGNGVGYWNIDHIIPQSYLLYDSLDHPNFLECWKLENLRPLCAVKNSSKGNRVDTTINS